MWKRFAQVLVGALLLALIFDQAFAAGRGRSKSSGSGEEGPPAVQLGNEKLFPVDTNWVADSLDGKQLWQGTDRPSIFIDKQLRLKGYDGCNMFSVTAYPLKGQKLAVGPLAVAKKACEATTVAAERSFLMPFGAPRSGTWRVRTSSSSKDLAARCASSVGSKAGAKRPSLLPGPPRAD